MSIPRPDWCSVSIHAPTRGATPPLRPGRSSPAVSIHAPTRGATSAGYVHFLRPVFQFTRPRGARPGCTHILQFPGTPFQFTRPRGARLPVPTRVSLTRSFNSRAHAGRDTIHCQCRSRSRLFQFTRPRGARRALRMLSPQTNQFQFTRPRGARLGPVLLLAVGVVSIHAPTRGATPLVGIEYDAIMVSIHAPTRGATLRHQCF